LKMIWGMTANNIGGLKFNRSDNETNPSDQNLELSTGLSWQPSWGPVRMLYAIDLRDLTMKHADDTIASQIKALIASGSVSTLELNLGFFQLIQEQAHLQFVPDSIRDILPMDLSSIPSYFFVFSTFKLQFTKRKLAKKLEIGLTNERSSK